MAEKKFGDVVTLVRNGVSLNALVAQSQPQTDGEHLTVVYLDPAFAGPIMGGSALQSAVATSFSVPLKDGAANGWKDVEVISEQQILQMQANAADAQAKDDAEWEKKVEALEKELDALKNQKPEPAPNAKTDAEVFAAVKAGLSKPVAHLEVPDGATLAQVVGAVNQFLDEMKPL